MHTFRQKLTLTLTLTLTLQDARVDLSHVDKDGRTPAHKAAKGGHVDEVHRRNNFSIGVMPCGGVTYFCLSPGCGSRALPAVPCPPSGPAPAPPFLPTSASIPLTPPPPAPTSPPLPPSTVDLPPSQPSAPTMGPPSPSALVPLPPSSPSPPLCRLHLLPPPPPPPPRYPHHP
ncbi:hypothetical protein CYMTET_23610 [Cymbomonas tetramitiformis]|uniref:Uncharacterized protein n=1 Tax=Cymbomonas tetramitiformis TaxID=36881 RepID=A0AAE0L0Y0_9CHLO|nr:hypothetical protein CYMTET_23610 [Cymbomonas tetramitiformis]